MAVWTRGWNVLDGGGDGADPPLWPEQRASVSKQLGDSQGPNTHACHQQRVKQLQLNCTYMGSVWLERML